MQNAAALIKATAASDETIATEASAELEDMGAPSAEDLPALIELLKHPHPDCGYWAATLIGRLGPLGALAVINLADAVASHPAISVRERAAWALGKIGPAARQAIIVLETASSTKSPRLARLAAEALSSIRANNVS